MRSLVQKVTVVCALAGLAAVLPFTAARAADIVENPFRLGTDVSMPYTLMLDGSGQRTRLNTNMGVDGRYFITNRTAFGARFYTDIQTRNNSLRQIGFVPGVWHQWLPGERFQPYLRAEIPVVLRAAASNSGSANRQDVGISGGFGLQWNIGGGIGFPGWSLRYDFDLYYLFGIGGAVNVVAFEFFKFGLDYSF